MSWITDPLNALPVVGFGPEIAAAARKGLPALREILKNPGARSFMDDAMRAGQRGGGPLPVGAADPLASAKTKIASYTKESAKVRPGQEAARHTETVERAAAFEAKKTKLLKAGLPLDEAVAKASTELRGKKTTRTLAEAIGFTDEEAAAFKDVIQNEAKSYEQVRLFTNDIERGRPSIFTKMKTNQLVTPAEATLLRRLFGDEVADASLALGRDVDELTRALEEAYGGGVIPIRRTVPVWKEAPIHEGGMLPLEDIGQSTTELAAIRRAQEEAYGVGARPISRMVPGAEAPPTGMPTPGMRPTEAGVLGQDLEPVLARQAAKDKAKMLKDLEKSYPVTPARQPFTTMERVMPGTQLGTEYAAKVSEPVYQAAKKPALATRIVDEILEIPRFFTGLYSLLDASVGGRQLRMLGTAFVGARKAGGKLPVSLQWPKPWARSYWDSTRLMFKTDASRAAYRAGLQADPTPIRIWHPDGHEDIPYGQLWQRAGGRLKEGEIDERVVSNILRKLPGFKQTAEGFELGLEAGHHSALKDELLSLAATGKKLTMKDVQALADATVALTGRGNLGKNLLADIATALGWAPRLRVAFWQSLFRLGHPNAKVRSLAARRVAGYIGTGLAMMGVADLTGAGKVTWNPLDTDFGKINIKGVRFNVWGPDVVAVRYLAQGIFGYAASPLTGKYEVDWKESLLRYARSGANPAVGLFIDWRTGKTYTGEPFNILDWQNRLPLAMQDIVDAFELKGGGLVGAAWGAIVSPFVAGGIGVQSYDRAEDKLARRYNEYVDQGKFGEDALYYADEEDLTKIANIQKFDDLTTLDTERNILTLMENDEVKAGIEQEYNLPDFAKRFNEGETALGPELMKRFREYKHDKHVAMDARTFGVDFGPESEDEKLLNAWMSINPHDPKYADPVTGQPDYDLIDADSEEAEAALMQSNPRLYQAVSEIISALDPELAEVEPTLEGALALRSDSYDFDRWTSDIKNQDQVADVLTLADRKNRELALQGYPNISMATVYNEVAAEHPEFSKQVIDDAYALRSGTRASKIYQNPERADFLLANQEALLAFFPDLYPEELLAEIGTGASSQAASTTPWWLEGEAQATSAGGTTPWWLQPD
jgi:hypothetical protein